MASLIVDLIVPGAGSVLDVLTTIFSLCQEMKESQETCVRVHGRLTDIFTELQKMEKAGQLPPSESLGRYTEVLASYLDYLSRYANKSLVMRLILYRKMMGELESQNEEIDMTMKLLNLATAGAMMQWKQQWEQDQENQMAVLMKLVSNSDAVLGEVKGTQAQMKAMTMLQYEINRDQGRQQAELFRQGQQTDEIFRMIKTLQTQLVRASSVRVPATPAWFIAESDVEYDRTPFARGSFGAVHRGTLGSGADVVVKTVLLDEDGLTEAMMKQFMSEVDIWHKLNHPHVVHMFGACHVSSPPFIVCEDASNGNLADYLTSRQPGERRMWQLLYEVALGIECLHKHRVVHGDLKLNNLLVGANGKALVADFGLSVVRQSTSVLSAPTANETSSAGGLRWRAPECMQGRPRFESDVYSLAMCIIEAATGEPPFAFADDTTVYHLLCDGKIPAKPATMEDDAWELVTSMTAFEPARRCSLANVIANLKTFAQREAAARKQSICNDNDKQSADGDIADEPVEPVTDDERNEIESLVGLLSHGTDAQKAQAIKALSTLASEAANQVAIASAGGIDPLIQLVRAGSDEQKERAADALFHLAWNDENEVAIAKAGGIEPLIELVRDGTSAQKKYAAGALANLALNDSNKEAIAIAGGIEALVALVCDGNDAQKDNATAALSCLAWNDANKEAIASAGGLEPLVKLVRDGSNLQKEQAASTLMTVACNDANQVAIAIAGGIEALVELVRDGSAEQKEQAAGALFNLALNDENKEAIARAGGIEPLVKLTRHGTDAQKENAADALRNLACNDAIKVAIASAEGIDELVELVRDGNGAQKKHAARTVGDLARKSVRNRTEIIEKGAIVPLVELLTSGNDDQKTQAAFALGSIMKNEGVRQQIKDLGGVAALQYIAKAGSDRQMARCVRISSICTVS